MAKQKTSLIGAGVDALFQGVRPESMSEKRDLAEQQETSATEVKLKNSSKQKGKKVAGGYTLLSSTVVKLQKIKIHDLEDRGERSSFADLIDEAIDDLFKKRGLSD